MSNAPEESGTDVTAERFDDASMLDFTVTGPVSAAQVARACAEARAHGFAAVVVHPLYVPLAADLLKGSPTRACAAVGGPFGALTTRQQVYESVTALEDGALEIELTLHSPTLVDGDEQAIRQDILAVAQVVARNPYAMLKVVVDVEAVGDELRRVAVRLAIEGAAHYVVLRRGDDGGAVAPASVAAALVAAGNAIGVKAAGVHSTAEARALAAAGAGRLGSPNAPALIA